MLTDVSVEEAELAVGEVGVCGGRGWVVRLWLEEVEKCVAS